MSEAYAIQKIVVLPPTTPEKKRQGYNDLLVFTSSKIFHFKNVLLTVLIENKAKEFSVRVWKSVSKQYQRMYYNRTIMEISLTQHSYRPWVKRMAGSGYGKQLVNEITESDLPAIKEKVVMNLI